MNATPRMHVAMALALALPGLALAATPSNVEMRDAVRAIETEFKEESERCLPMKGDAQQRCEAEARARRDAAKARTAEIHGDSNTRLEAANAESRSRHRTAKAGCDALEGERKRSCLEAAKATREQERVAAFNDAGQDRLEASYGAEIERCDSATERDRAGCQARARAKYGKPGR